MPVTMRELGVDRLTPEDRFALLQEIWDSLAPEIEKAPLSETQEQEVDRRLNAHRANPQGATSWEDVEAEVLARLRQ